MAQCERCGTEKRVNKYCLRKGTDKLLCVNCYKGVKSGESYYSEEQLQKMIENAPKIKCPYCGQWFPKLTDIEYSTSAGVNVAKWAIVPAWGVIGALKNKPFVQCPHCKMKIMQG